MNKWMIGAISGVIVVCCIAFVLLITSGDSPLPVSSDPVRHGPVDSAPESKPSRRLDPQDGSEVRESPATIGGAEARDAEGPRRKGAWITGRVLSPAGEALGASRVTLSLHDPYDSFPQYRLLLPRPVDTSTDVDGRFRFDGLNVDLPTLTIRIEAVGFAVHRRRVFLRQDVCVKLRRPGELSGVITSRTSRQACPGAIVSAVQRSMHDGTMTSSFGVRADEGGHFRIRAMPPGTYQVGVTSADHASSPATTVIIERDRRTVLNLQLDDGFELHGQIVPVRGARLSGRASIRKRRSSRECVTADMTGRFILRGLSIGDSVQIQCEHCATQVIQLEPTEEEIRRGVLSRMFEVGPAPVIKGRVVRDGGIGVTGATVSIQETHVATETGGEGRFEIEVSGGRTRVHLSVRKAGFATKISDVVEPAPPDAAKEVEIALGPGAKVRGVVSDEEGRPAPGIAVWLRCPRAGQSFPVMKTVSGAEGRFLFDLVPPGICDLTCLSIMFPDRQFRTRASLRGLIVKPRETSPEIQLVHPRPATITGVVLDELSKPVPDVLVRVTLHNALAYSDADGRFELTGLLAGCPARFYCRKEGFAVGGKPVVLGAVHSGQHLEIRIKRKAPPILGRVVDANLGSPIQGFWVRAFRVNGPLLANGMPNLARPRRAVRFSDAEGRFRLPLRGSKADFLVDAGTDDDMACMNPVIARVSAGAAPRPVVLKLTAGGAVRGRAISPSGGAVHAARIQARTSKDNRLIGNERSYSDRLGRFHIRSLPPGLVRVVAVDRKFGRVSTVVRVEPRSTTDIELAFGKQESEHLTLEILVHGASGEPLTGARITLLTGQGKEIPVEVRKAFDAHFAAWSKKHPGAGSEGFRRTLSYTDNRGVLIRHYLEPGRYRVVVTREGYKAMTRDVQVLSGQVNRLEVGLSPIGN